MAYRPLLELGASWSTTLSTILDINTIYLLNQKIAIIKTKIPCVGH